MGTLIDYEADVLPNLMPSPDNWYLYGSQTPSLWEINPTGELHYVGHYNYFYKNISHSGGAKTINLIVRWKADSSSFPQGTTFEYYKEWAKGVKLGFWNNHIFFQGGDLGTSESLSIDTTNYQVYRLKIDMTSEKCSFYYNDILKVGESGLFIGNWGGNICLFECGDVTQRIDYIKLVEVADYVLNFSENFSVSDSKENQIGKYFAESFDTQDKMIKSQIWKKNFSESLFLNESLEAGRNKQTHLNESLQLVDSLDVRRFKLESAYAFIKDKSKVITKEVF